MMNLQSINGIKLTTREIDIISCIVNSRKTKKIANLLFLSPRTVEAHIQNIMSKFRCNSQDSIIDFVEKSPEFKFIKNHYLDLLIKTAFERQLKRISYLSKKYKVCCCISYDKLSKEEVYSELAIIKDMPEMYTRIMYALERTYIYQGNREEAIRYFELSKHLGNKLGLFEGYLSNISGLEVIKKDKIDIDIKNGNYDQAKAKLLDSINLYKKLKDDTTVYTLDYKPGVMISQQMIIPKENIYNQVECGSRIAELYSKLIITTNNVNKKQII